MADVAGRDDVCYCSRFIGGPADGTEVFEPRARKGCWGVLGEHKLAEVRPMYMAEGEPEQGPEFIPGTLVVRLTYRGDMDREAADVFCRQHGLNLGPDCSTPRPKVDVACHPWGDRVAFWCPGCGASHEFHARTDGQAPSWFWNRDMGRPTVTPSIMVNRGRANPAAPQCHAILTDGVLHFQDDCTHPLAGQEVALADIPASDGGKLLGD
jgi:hypothetical protein